MEQPSPDYIKLSRDVQAIEIPAGHTIALPAGTDVKITQSLGGSHTLWVPSYGGLFRLNRKDADAVGMPIPEETAASGGPVSAEELNDRVWTVLRTCYDPEIPVNIVDLGLIYGMTILDLDEAGAKRVEVKMTLTAQGCGMGASIAFDAQNKLLELPGVREADVQVVWEPAWSPERISPAGRATLGW